MFDKEDNLIFGESLLTDLESNIITYTIIVDTSGSISSSVFSTVKLCVLGLIKIISKESKISVINFSNDAKVVSEYKTDKKKLEEEVENGLHHLSAGTNLISALELASMRIDLFQPNKKSKNIIIIITDGHPDKDPTFLTIDLIKKGIEFLGIAVGNVSKSNFEKMLPGQQIFYFDTYKNLCENIQSNLNKKKFPLSYKVYPSNNNIQRSNETLFLDFEISPSANLDSFDKDTIEIKILENDYYFGFTCKVGIKIDQNNPFIAKMCLKVKNNSKTKDLPKRIEFEIEIINDVYSGYFHMDFAWYSGDLKNDYNINIMVEGQIGNGKSSLLNSIFNLFTSDQKIQHSFTTSRSSGHVTTAIEYNPILNLLNSKSRDRDFLPIYQKIIENIKITLVDKPGMTLENEGSISILKAREGCYENGMSKDNIVAGLPNPFFSIHAFIFVVSIKCFIGEESDLKMVKIKIEECISKAKIKPILAITFCDHFSNEELESCKGDIEKLPVDKENVFYFLSYIDNETKRDPNKDFIAWNLLKCAFQIGKQTIELERVKDSNRQYFNNIINKYNNNNDNNNYNNLSTGIVGEFSSSNSLNLNLPLENVSLGMITSPIKPWTISVEEGNSTFKFRVSPKITLDNFKLDVSKQIEKDPSAYYFEDDQGCILSGKSTIDELLDNTSKITIVYQ